MQQATHQAMHQAAAYARRMRAAAWTPQSYCINLMVNGHGGVPGCEPPVQHHPRDPLEGLHTPAPGFVYLASLYTCPVCTCLAH